MVVLTMAAAGCDRTDEASDTGVARPAAATTEPAASIAEPTTIDAPASAELLTVGDMPAAVSWSVDQLPAGFWATDSPGSSEAFSVHMCDPMAGSVWAIVPPADERHRVGQTWRSEGHGTLTEVVFSGDSSELQNDFDAITQGLTDCLEGPGDPNLAESGWDLVADELPTVGVGDADYLVRQRLYYGDSDPSKPFCDHRLAIVLDGTRLILVDYTVMGGIESVSDGDFARTVQNAAQRITS